MKIKIYLISITFLLILSIGKNLEAKQDRIDSFNAGYRAGRLEGVAELIECEGVTDSRVVTAYNEASRILAGYGELDESPYPCGLR